MFKKQKIFLLLSLFGVIISACTGAPSAGPTATAVPPTAVAPTVIPTIPADLPKITTVQLDRQELPRYEALEIKVGIQANYKNAYDAREIRLDAVFIAPDGQAFQVPGFWDGEIDWKVRFTPSQEGQWNYQIAITDKNGTSEPSLGAFTVSSSTLHGWVLPGKQVNETYSNRYLVHHDGTPFYGIGHGDALNILIDRIDAENGVGLFNNMKTVGENYVVWWPLFALSPIKADYSKYMTANMKIIDSIVRDAEKKDIYLVYTIWDHPQLRGLEHPWGAGNWNSSNGFRKLTTVEEFFTNAEAWAWQENFYRYTIARWGYSRSILMWQLVSEINGTNAGDQMNPWHAKVNEFFVANDPYRHPTTASMSGDVDWLEGYKTTDAPQVHVYDFPNTDVVQAADVLASWTQRMWKAEEKPNWIGEFGVIATEAYPDLFHNGIWAALGAGAAMTPAEWNDGRGWARLTPEMTADLTRMGQFLAEIPLAKLNPAPLTIQFAEKDIRAWGVAGTDGGLVWVQDFSQQGTKTSEIHKNLVVRKGILANVTGMAGGTYIVTPYNTWTGEWLEPLEITCEAGKECPIILPDFTADIALKIMKK